MTATRVSAAIEPHITTRRHRTQRTAVGPGGLVADAAAEGDGRLDIDLDKQVTQTADLVRVYLNEISKVPLLSAEQEVELAKRIEAGLYAEHLLAEDAELAKLRVADRPEGCQRRMSWQYRRMLALAVADGRRAKDHLLQANLRLVVSLAKRYTGHGVPFLDLIQEGNLGLIRAVEKFDYTKGFKFSTYATWWIRQAVTRAMADQGRTIRLPVHLVEQVNKLQRTRRLMHQQLGRDATEEELAAELDLEPSKVSELLQHSRDLVSLDQTVGDDDDAELADFIEDTAARRPGDDMEQAGLSDDLAWALGLLEPQERQVLTLFYNLDRGGAHTRAEIGRIMGVTDRRVGQLLAAARTKLRTVPYLAERLCPYVEDP